ncbi:hypothetical protein THUN1379_17740 [Paludibacterium sp. THUN1379]|uniref:hypothetical protein n=1 Tax=Paludibacterium sp. THUN1379 TaxID=3112107 RepID=UPI003092016F|nr:hypothetical protein THUN1379_17740 [Paludibacterium sp. THUN1379]
MSNANFSVFDRLRQAQGNAHDLISMVLMLKPDGVMRIARRADMYLTLIRSALARQGGNLEVKIRFADGEQDVPAFATLAAAAAADGGVGQGTGPALSPGL